MKRATEDSFWMVWCPLGGAPTVKHETKHSAEKEAERLARYHPGRSFYVLEAECGFCTEDPVTRIEMVGHIPF